MRLPRYQHNKILNEMFRSDDGEYVLREDVARELEKLSEKFDKAYKMLLDEKHKRQTLEFQLENAQEIITRLSSFSQTKGIAHGRFSRSLKSSR